MSGTQFECADHQKILTGATGSLGLEILRALDRHPRLRIDNVICLIRAASDLEAKLRLEALLRDRSVDLQCGFEAYAADLSQPELGLSPTGFAHCLREVDVVLHVSDESYAQQD